MPDSNDSKATPISFEWNDDPESVGAGATLSPHDRGLCQIDAFTVRAIADGGALTGFQWEIASQAADDTEARREVEVAIAAIEAYRAARAS